MRLPTNGEALSPIEQEFFRAGDEMDSTDATDEAAAVENEPPRSAWSRWFSRTRRASTDTTFAEADESGT